MTQILVVASTLISLLFNVDSFVWPVSKLLMIRQNTIHLNSKESDTGSISERQRPSPQMIPIPFDYFDTDEDDLINQDDSEDLFDNQAFGVYDVDALIPAAPAYMFASEFDAPSNTLLEVIFESPYDSPAIVYTKNLFRSMSLLVLLLATTFTASYYCFPGSFQHYTVIGQFHPRYTSSFLTFPPFEQTEYSESGGVNWGDNDESLPKTTVTINDGVYHSSSEDVEYEVNYETLTDL
jgi:hypothetical protein